MLASATKDRKLWRTMNVQDLKIDTFQDLGDHDTEKKKIYLLIKRGKKKKNRKKKK